MSSPDTDPRPPTGSPGAGEQVTAAPIAGGYSPAYRALDTLSIGAFLALCAALVEVVGERAWLHALFGFTGPLVADLVTGMVHWAADTWGTVRWPVVGPLFIRTFREHHVDPMAITRHDFVETNGSNAMVTLPLLAAAAWLGSPWLAAAVLWLCLWVMATNQLHKWAHAGPASPRWVCWLQRRGLVLTPERHAVQDRAPYLQSYCITGGWLNPLLDRLGFFRWLERRITAVTGAHPRAEDRELTNG